MITRIPFRPKPRPGLDLSAQALRWASYDRAALTKDALKKRVESGFDNNGDSTIHLNTDDMTISTAAGDLPVSPLFDPDWMKARRRQRKENPSKPMGRFRKKLANNPYAQALATPVRLCPITRVELPRYFLQDFEMVKHPEDGSPWWAPGTVSSERLKDQRKTPKNGNEITDSKIAAEQSQPTNVRGLPSSSTSNTRPQRGPLISYALSRKSIIDSMGREGRGGAAMLLKTRTGMALAAKNRRAVWRKDMGDVLLQMMRRQAVDALKSWADVEAEEDNRILQPCKNWDDVKEVKPRGCVLWFPDQADAATQFATFDIDGAKYGSKVMVHNLRWLLGESEAERLRDASRLFHDNEILVLKQWKRKAVMELHLSLWRLHGYLAEPLSM